jgi:F-type H+-transporting ATPase subunit c
MTRNIKALGLLFFIIIIMSAPLLAQPAEDLSSNKASLLKWAIIIGGAIIAIAASAGAYCQSRAISSALEGISRNPSSAPHIRFLLIFGLVLIETLVIYTLLISIIILMVNWSKI